MEIEKEVLRFNWSFAIVMVFAVAFDLALIYMFLRGL